MGKELNELAVKYNLKIKNFDSTVKVFFNNIVCSRKDVDESLIKCFEDYSEKSRKIISFYNSYNKMFMQIR